MSKIYTKHGNTIIRFHKRKEVKDFFEVLSKNSTFNVSDILSWPAVAMLLFNTDKSKNLVVASNVDYGYSVIDLDSGDVKSDIRIEIEDPRVLAYFKAIVVHYLNHANLDEDKRNVQLINLALADGGIRDSDGDLIVKHLGKGHQDFGAFKIKFDFDSDIKAIKLYDFSSKALAGFGKEIVINDFSSSAELLFAIIEKSKLKQNSIDPFLNLILGNELKPSRMMFTPHIENEKCQLNHKVNDELLQKLESPCLYYIKRSKGYKSE